MSAVGDVVVVGAGLAGLRTVEELRAAGHTGSITLLGEESDAPYDRPPLSKQVLRGERDVVPLREDLDSLDADVRLGVTAVALDPERSAVRLESGADVRYDVAVIATGATPKALPGYENDPRIAYLRTASDSRRLHKALTGARHLVVVGGGFIGCEVAASARAMGVGVTIVEVLPRPLVRVLGERVAALVQEIHVSHGVDVRGGTRVTTIAGDGAIEGVTLEDGTEIDADVLLAGLGVAPVTGWLEGSGVAVGDGVLCDAFCATSVPGVYAVGDVARWQNASTGDARRVEHWTNAIEMAAVVARNIVGASGEPTPFRTVPYVWSDQYDVKLQSVGFYAADDDVTIVQVGPKQRTLAVYGRDGALTGAVGFSAAPQVMKLRGLIAAGGARVEDALSAVS